MRQFIETTLHPERYHGHGKRAPFFEGWYFKMVSPSEGARFAVIPGIFISDDPERHHAFVQVFDGVSGQASYHRYPASSFQAARDAFDVCIGPNRFQADSLHLEIDDEQHTVYGDLRFSGLTPWPVTAFSPGIMGPFGWLSFMECYHGVVSLDHAVYGSLNVGGQTVNFDNGRGYIEKDWGQAFPSAWVWMQTNHFDRPGISLSASTAVIPFMGTWFPGFIVGFWLEGTLHRFATYVGAKIEHLKADEHHVAWTLLNRTHRLEIKAERAATAALPGPSRQDMGVRVLETLQANIHVRLSTLKGQEIYNGTGRCGGMEVMGNLERLET